MTVDTSEHPPVDERFLQRREAVAQERTRRRRRGVVLVVVLLALAGGAVAVARSSLFTVAEVRVEGFGNGRTAAVLAAIDVPGDANLLTADLAGAEDRVETLPWVRQARIVRRLPATVVVRVEPRTPVLVVQSADRRHLVDDRGVVVPGRGRDGLPVARVPRAVLPGPGTRVSDAAVRETLAVHRRLPASLRAATAAYRATTQHDVQLRLRTGRLDDPALAALPIGAVWVRVGDSAQLPAKGRVLLALLAQLAGREPPAIAEIDVRAPDHPVIVPAGSR